MSSFFVFPRPAASPSTGQASPAGRRATAACRYAATTKAAPAAISPPPRRRRLGRCPAPAPSAPAPRRCATAIRPAAATSTISPPPAAIRRTPWCGAHPPPSGYSGALAASRPPGDQEQEENNNGPPVTDDDLIELIQNVLEKLPGNARNRFAGKLATVLAGLEHPQAGGNGNGGRFIGARPSLGAAPGMTNANGRPNGNGRTPAQDAALRGLQSRDFLRRFPDAAKITVIG